MGCLRKLLADAGVGSIPARPNGYEHGTPSSAAGGRVRDSKPHSGEQRKERPAPSNASPPRCHLRDHSREGDVLAFHDECCASSRREAEAAHELAGRMAAGIGFTGIYIGWFKVFDWSGPEAWWFEISPEGIGTPAGIPKRR